MTEARERYNAGQPAEPMISQVFQFRDGSRLKIIVESVPSQNEQDTATDLYYTLLYPMLGRLQRGEKQR